jgi:hypothetical protein
LSPIIVVSPHTAPTSSAKGLVGRALIPLATASRLLKHTIPTCTCELPEISELEGIGTPFRLQDRTLTTCYTAPTAHCRPASHRSCHGPLKTSVASAASAKTASEGGHITAAENHDWMFTKLATDWRQYA